MQAGFNDPMPSDKLMKLFIIQAISAFVANDYQNGIHFLNEIKQTYAQKMSQLNPTLKSLAKEIIQSVDMFNPTASGDQFAPTFEAPAEPQATNTQVAQQTQQAQSAQSQEEPSSVTNELQELLKRRREKRKG